MDEITPDFVARLASRIYNEVPMANHVPKSELDARQLPDHAQLPTELPTQYAPQAMPLSPTTAALTPQADGDARRDIKLLGGVYLW